ncbi:MAG: MFS transporter [Proteobacteria bacterium]|nr:MFS transporter [Pseudomonadota bacterium]
MSSILEGVKLKTLEQVKSKIGILPWVICAIGAIFYSYEYLLRISPSVMRADLMSHFGITATQFGLLSGLYYWAYVPMQLPVGLLMDRYGPKRLLTFACLICVVGTYMFVSNNVWMSGTGRFLVGFGSAFAFVGVLKLATIWLPENRLALVAGLTAALGKMGAMFGNISLTQMTSSIGWQQTVSISAVSGIFVAVIIWFVIKEKPTVAGKAKNTVDSFREVLLDAWLIIKNPQIWINGLYGCLVYLPTTVFAELWGNSYLEHAFHLTVKDASYGVSALFIGFTVGAPLWGWISDKIQLRRLPIIIGAIGAFFIALLLVSVEGLSLHMAMFLLFALGVMYGCQAIVFAVARELSPMAAAATAMAVTNMIVMLSTMTLQPFIGYLLDFSWSGQLTEAGTRLYTAADFRFAMSVLPIGIGIAVILAFFLKETHGEVEEE